MTTWDLDALTDDQKDVLSELCQTNDGSICLDEDDLGSAHDELCSLGLINLEPADGEVVVLLTLAGETWLRSLPEGALS